jgi:hypothetical protein
VGEETAAGGRRRRGTPDGLPSSKKWSFTTTPGAADSVNGQICIN